MLSTVAQHYKKDGYYIARNLLPIDAIQNAFFEMDIILLQQLNKSGFSELPSQSLEIVHEHMRKLHGKDQYSYIQSLKLWAKLYSVQSLVMHENILRLTKTLGITLPVFQTSQVLHVMANDLKITDGYHGVGAHQDWPALQSGLDTVTVWFPFMDVDKYNFALELIPGSHKHGLYPGKIAAHIFEVDSNSYNEEDFVPMEVNIGDVLFMSNFTLHRSSLIGDHRLRVACSSRYENASEKTFIERVYPSAQKRVIQRELIEPNFPQKTHLEEIFGN